MCHVFHDARTAPSPVFVSIIHHVHTLTRVESARQTALCNQVPAQVLHGFIPHARMSTQIPVLHMRTYMQAASSGDAGAGSCPWCAHHRCRHAVDISREKVSTPARKPLD
jgi:hypothetical protein